MCNHELEVDRAQGCSGKVLEDETPETEAPSTYRSIHESMMVILRVRHMPQGGIAHPVFRYDTYHPHGAGQVEGSQDVSSGPMVGCSVLGHGAEPLVRTQFLEHPPSLNFGANHLKKMDSAPSKTPHPLSFPT